MKKIGIILAIKEELQAVRTFLKDEKKEKIFNLNFYDGFINNFNCILVECGVGKVNAARTTQILIDKFQVDVVINIGVAGGIESSLSIGDIVIGTKLVQHDFDITSFGHEKGYITDVGKFIPADDELIKMILKSTKKKEFEKINIKQGTIASGDIFCTEIEMAKKIKNEFGALCVEMEGAAVAQVCYLSNIPFIVLRSISDVPNGNNQIDFTTFINSSSKIIAQLLVSSLDK